MQAEYRWRWPLLFEYLLRPAGEEETLFAFESGLLLKGLFSTLRLGFWAMLLALILGGSAGMMFAHARGFKAAPYVMYVQLIRNTPPLILLFLMYFVVGGVVSFTVLDDMAFRLPPWGQSILSTLYAAPGQLDRMTAATLTLGLYTGAYVAEIVRGALESVPRTQWEASAALGFTRWQTLHEILLPQVRPLLASPLVGQTISTFKGSALAALISLPELTFQSLEIMAVSRMTYEVWLVCALLYLAIGLVCSVVGKRFENPPWRA